MSDETLHRKYLVWHWVALQFLVCFLCMLNDLKNVDWDFFSFNHLSCVLFQPVPSQMKYHLLWLFHWKRSMTQGSRLSTPASQAMCPGEAWDDLHVLSPECGPSTPWNVHVSLKLCSSSLSPNFSPLVWVLDIWWEKSSLFLLRVHRAGGSTQQQ